MSALYEIAATSPGHGVATSPAPDTDVFEGPEKKLEVFFSPSADSKGFRFFGEVEWASLLADAKCSILHVQPSSHFDAYLLSESSLFVYPSRVILKTCGTTTLLLVLPKLLELASSIGVSLDHLHYSHLRYKFPSLQLYPHTSFAAESQYLDKVLPDHATHARVIGPPTGACWYALCTHPRTHPCGPVNESMQRPAKRPHVAKADVGGAALPAECDDLFEVAMEGLPADVCDVFYGSHAVHAGATGRELGRSMTLASGIGAMLPGVTIDDWAFSPCGYSMNGHRGAFYYTIHITPELAFSYASFETNDPSYRAEAKLLDVARVFQPSTMTVTLTTRTAGRGPRELPSYALAGYASTDDTHTLLTPRIHVHCINLTSRALASAARALEMPVEIALPVEIAADACGLKAVDCARGDDANAYDESEASSDDTELVATHVLEL